MDARFAHRVRGSSARHWSLLIWFVWPVSYTLWPSKPKTDQRA
jgi:hypothetical protein